MKNIINFFFLLLPLLFTHSLISQLISNNQLSNLIEKSNALNNSYIGVSVFDIKINKEILSYNSDKLFTPASTLKLLYTLSAIDSKGKDFKFKTKFYYTGNIIFDGTLEGDLLIYASGDPSFGSPRFYKEGVLSIFKGIEKAIRSIGIKCIDGDIILVIPKNSYPVNGSWTVEDLGNYYAGGAWPLNFNDNEYKVIFNTGNKESYPTKIISIIPEIPFLKIDNQVISGKPNSSDNSYIYGMPYSFDRIIKGTLPVNKNRFTIKGAIPNPPLTFLRLLYSYFEERGIYTNNIRISETSPNNKKPIFDIVSPNLLKITKICNDYSINMYSEALSQLLCLKENTPNDYLNQEEIETFLSQYNIDFKSTQIVDGCGLSSKNLISPNSLNQFIKLMIDKMGLKTVLDILPQARVDGYAKNILYKNIWVKSGSISGVLNYSGILKSNSDYYIFTIMTNNSNDSQRKQIKKQLLNIIKKIKTH